MVSNECHCAANLSFDLGNSGDFAPDIFHVQMVEYTDAEPLDMEDQL